MNEKKIETICILTLGLLGDVLMRTPFIREVRNRFQNAHIVCIADKIGAEILKLNPDIDTVCVMDRNRNNKFTYLMSKAKTQLFLIKNNFDLVIDLYGGNSTTRMMKSSFAYYQIGFVNGKPYSNRLKLYDIKNNLSNSKHLTHNLFVLLGYLMRDFNPSTKPTIQISETSNLNMKHYLQSFGEGKYFLVSFGSGGLEKILDLNIQLTLIEYVYNKYKIIPAIVLNPGQEFLQYDSVYFLKSKNIPFVKLKYLSLEEISSLMINVEFIMVPDTGLFHMGVAVGVPIYCIFTYTNPSLVFPDSGIIETCFIEDELDIKTGLYFGTKNISLDFLKLKMDILIDKINS